MNGAARGLKRNHTAEGGGATRRAPRGRAKTPVVRG